MDGEEAVTDRDLEGLDGEEAVTDRDLDRVGEKRNSIGMKKNNGCFLSDSIIKYFLIKLVFDYLIIYYVNKIRLLFLFTR